MILQNLFTKIAKTPARAAATLPACDEWKKGVPIAFLLFSAPTGNQATHTGYNTQILQELLSHWKGHLNRTSEQSNCFKPLVTITDTDTKEQGVLSDVWPHIHLLICRFHLHQCDSVGQTIVRLLCGALVKSFGRTKFAIFLGRLKRS